MTDFEIPFASTGIPARLRIPVSSKKVPGFLLLHGFTSKKEGDGQMLELFAESLCINGYAVLQIDFCSCGNSRAPREDYTIDRMCMEAKCAFDFLRQHELVDENQCGIIAHSLGSRIASIIASENIAMLVLLNGALGDYYRTPIWFKGELPRMEKELNLYGKTTFLKSNQEFVELYPAFFTSLKNNDDYALHDYANPVLFCYGEKDPTADPQATIDAYYHSKSEKKKLLCIKEANHTFQAKTNDHTILNECIKQVIEWIQSNVV